MLESSFASYNVIAAYRDHDAAENAVEVLQAASVPDEELSLLTRHDEDESEVTSGFKKMLAGGGAGGGAGAAAGFAAGLAAFGIPGVGPVIGAGVWSATVGGAAAGAATGATATNFSQLRDIEAWEMTLRDVDEGMTVVGVHTDDEDRFHQVSDVLTTTEPVHVRRFDQQGNLLIDEN